MALIDELKDRRERQTESLANIYEAIRERQEYLRGVEFELEDLDTAIAALTPQEAPDITAAVAEPIDPPTIEEVLSLAPDEPAEHISILTGDPAIEPETGLHGDPVLRSVEIDGEWIDGDDEEGNKRSVEYSQGFEAGRLGGERDPDQDQSENWWTGYADGKARRDEVAASEGYAPVVAADEPEPEPEPSLLDRFNPFRVKADA